MNKMKGFKCLVCGYEGLDFKLNLRTHTYAVGQVVGNTGFIIPAHRCLEDKYDQEDAKRGLVCPRCSVASWPKLNVRGRGCLKGG